MDAMKKSWKVLIKGLGAKTVIASDDIDDAYMAAMKEFNCKLDDILAVGFMKLDIDSNGFEKYIQTLHDGEV